MSNRKFSDEQLAWLAKRYQDTRTRDLVAQFNAHFGRNVREANLKNVLSRHGIRSGLGPGLRQGERPSQTWTPERVDWLRQHRAQGTVDAVTCAFNARFGTNVQPHCIANTCKRYGIRGQKSRFRPGQTPWNAGQSHPSTGRALETQFQPGHRPSSWVPIGSTRINDGRLERKIADHPPGYAHKNWRPVARITWEQANGPVPRGHIVLMIDPDPARSEDLDNIVLVTRAELARLNQLGWGRLATPALRKAAVGVAKLHQRAHDAGRKAGLADAERRRLIGKLGAFAPRTER